MRLRFQRRTWLTAAVSAVDAADTPGVRVLLVLAHACPWANGGHADDKWFPTDDDDWTSIIDRTVRHVGAKVQAYEVWNEPNDNTFGDYAGDPEARYWQLVRLSRQSVRASCATCVVVAGASTDDGSAATELAYVHSVMVQYGKTAKKIWANFGVVTTTFATKEPLFSGRSTALRTTGHPARGSSASGSRRPLTSQEAARQATEPFFEPCRPA